MVFYKVVLEQKKRDRGNTGIMLEAEGEKPSILSAKT